MIRSDSINALAQAILAAQKNIGAASKGSTNPFFNSFYASLGDVMEACKEHLLAEGISVLQPLGSDEHGDYVETILLHETGEFISDKARLHIAKENDPQAYGSATTYARRYGLQSMLFIPAEDDDAEGATQRHAAPPLAHRQQQARQREPEEIRKPSKQPDDQDFIPF